MQMLELTGHFAPFCHLGETKPFLLVRALSTPSLNRKSPKPGTPYNRPRPIPTPLSRFPKNLGQCRAAPGGRYGCGRTKGRDVKVEEDLHHTVKHQTMKFLPTSAVQCAASCEKRLTKGRPRNMR